MTTDEALEALKRAAVEWDEVKSDPDRCDEGQAYIARLQGAARAYARAKKETA